MSSFCDICACKLSRGNHCELNTLTEAGYEVIDTCLSCRAEIRAAYQLISEEINEAENTRRRAVIENLIAVNTRNRVGP